MQHGGKVGLLLVAVFLFTIFNYGGTIRCYDCNSSWDPRCGRGERPKFESGDNLLDDFKRDCDSHGDGIKYTFCRKTEQTIQKPYNTRVSRSCGYVRDTNSDSCKWSSPGYGTQSYSCSCFTDYCNSAKVATATLLTLLGAQLFLRMC